MKVLQIFTLFLYILQTTLQLHEALSLYERDFDDTEWFNLQISTPYVRKFVFNDDIKQKLKNSNQSAVNVLEAKFTALESDPKTDLIISFIGSQFYDRSPVIIWYEDLDKEGNECGRGSALCFINKEILTEKKIIFLRIQCISSCEFEVFLQYKLSDEIISNRESNIRLIDKEYIKISKLMIEDDFQQVKGLQIKFINISKRKHGFDVYLFKGQNFNSTLNSLSNPLTTVDYGKIIRLDLDERIQDFEDLTVVLRSEAKQQFMIVVEFIYFDDLLPIKLNTFTNYILRPNEYIIFKGQNDSGQLPWKQQNYVCIDITFHEGSGMFYIDNKINDSDEKNRIQQAFYNSQSTCLEKQFFEKQGEKFPTFYIKVLADDDDVSLTVSYTLQNLSKYQNINTDSQKYLSLSSKTQNYIIYDLAYELSTQQTVGIQLDDLILQQNNHNNQQSNIKMIVKSCAESIYNNKVCKLTADDVNNEIKGITSSTFIPVIKLSNGSTQFVQLNQFQQTNSTDYQYFRYLIAILPSDDGLVNIIKLTTSIQNTFEIIQPFKVYKGELLNFQKKFLQFKLRIPPLQVSTEIKQVTLYISTSYGNIDVESSQKNPMLSEYVAQRSPKTQRVSATFTLSGETYFTYDIEQNPQDTNNQERNIFLSLSAKSQSKYSVYVYVQNAQKNILGNLRSIGKNLDLGRINDSKLCDASTMNTLNLYLPFNTTNIFIYFFIDYSDINFDKVKKDISIMTQKQDKKKKVQVTPYIQMTDLQTGVVLDQSEYNSTLVNDGLLYVQTNNKVNQYYQLDIMNNYSLSYNISIYYSLLYTSSNYYFLKSGFKYQINLDENTKSQIVFFYAKQNTNVFFQIFTCNGTFSFQQWFQKPTKEESEVSFTIDSYQDVNLYVEQNGFYYFSFNLMGPQTKGEIIFNLHIYDSNELSPYDLISTPKVQYEIQQNNDQMIIDFNYLNLNTKLVEQLDEQIFSPTSDLTNDYDDQEEQQQSQKPTQYQQQKSYELDLNNTKALKNILKDTQTIKILYFTQLSTSNKLVSYCNPCFLKQRSYEQFYLLDRRSFNSSNEQINSITYNKRDLIHQISKRSPQDITNITDIEPDSLLDVNATLNTTLYFNILAILEIKDNIGQLTEQFYFVYDTKEIYFSYKNISEIETREQQIKVDQSKQYTIIICVVVFTILLLIALICSYRIFRKDTKLPCSCFLQQVYTDIPDTDTKEMRMKKASKNKANDINVKVRDSIQEFLNVKQRRHKQSNSPPPPTLEESHQT